MDHIIFFYIFICIALLVFNIGYILRSQGRSRGMERSIRRWQAEMHAQWASGSITPVHREHLTRRLKKIRPLLAYHTALRPELEHPSAPVHRYLEEVRPVFQELALSYQKRPAMERAFFAYVIAEFFPAGRPSQDRLAELLLGFLDDSTVYCRENVLLALCSLGNAGALERALERFHRQNWYHHPRLLSDGLATFSGNQTALARRLWKAAASWNENLQVAVVQFAAGLPLGGGQELSDSLLAALSQKKLSLETGFAILRYFQRHPHPEAKPVLLDLAMRNTDEGGLAIAACSALSQYPGADTIQALKSALHSRNWYVRRNAAASLASLGLSEEDRRELSQDPDQYAREMLSYMLRLNDKRPPSGISGGTVSLSTAPQEVTQ